jgi:2-dehydropantoate 2-reductase
MKIAIMGAGAVGCYYGAMLARAGHPVTVVGRAQHVAAVQARGLLLETATFTEAVRVDATVDPSGVADADTVLLCVKSGDTVAAGREMSPHLKTDASVLSLQNGVDNAERLQAVLRRPVIPTAVYVAVDMPAPGHVRHHGRGELVIGPSPLSSDIADAFRRAGIPTDVSDQVVGALWAKLIVNCAYNALSAIAQLPYGRLTEVDGVRDVMTDVVAECVAVAERLDVKVPGEILSTVLELAASMPNQFSSTAQDLARGKQSEIDHLNGYVVRTAARLGIKVPVNRSLLVIVKLLELKAQAANPETSSRHTPPS